MPADEPALARKARFQFVKCCKQVTKSLLVRRLALRQPGAVHAIVDVVVNEKVYLVDLGTQRSWIKIETGRAKAIYGPISAAAVS